MPAIAVRSRRRRGAAQKGAAKAPTSAEARTRAKGGTGGSVSGVALRYGRLVVMGALAVVILVAGVWGSWGAAQYVMLTKGRERGTVEVTRCGARVCTGPYAPLSAGSTPRARVVLEKSVAVRKGRTYAVVLKPGGVEAVRSGPAGVLYAWVPFGGALLLASVVVAGGLGRVRWGWVLAGSGAALLTAAFLAI